MTRTINASMALLHIKIFKRNELTNIIIVVESEIAEWYCEIHPFAMRGDSKFDTIEIQSCCSVPRSQAAGARWEIPS